MMPCQLEITEIFLFKIRQVSFTITLHRDVLVGSGAALRGTVRGEVVELMGRLATIDPEKCDTGIVGGRYLAKYDEFNVTTTLTPEIANSSNVSLDSVLLDIVCQALDGERTRLGVERDDLLLWDDPKPGTKLYRRLHAACPQCGSTRERTETTMGVIGLADQNLTGCECGWRGRVHDLVPAKPCCE